MKRAISLLLALIMTTSMLVGCTNKKTSGEGTSLTIGIPQSSTITSYTNNNAFTDYLKELSGIDIEFYYFSSSGSEYTQQLALMCSANQKLPDVILGLDLGHYVMNQYGEDGFFIDLTELIDKYAENYKKALGELKKESPEMAEYASEKVKNTKDGAIYETGKRMTGGLMGFVVIKVDVSNCLNTGTIDVRNYTVPNDPKSEHVQPYAGGLFGYVYPNSKTTITDCMSTGKILVSDAVTSAAGSILGYSSGTTKISNTYATKESCKNTTRGNIEGDVIVYEEAQLKGYGGYQWTGLDFNKYWVVVLDDTSVLKSFAKSVLTVLWFSGSCQYA